MPKSSGTAGSRRARSDHEALRRCFASDDYVAVSGDGDVAYAARNIHRGLHHAVRIDAPDGAAFGGIDAHVGDQVGVAGGASMATA